MLKKIALAVVLLIVAVLAYAATRPDYTRYERSTQIHASPATLQPLIADFREWKGWSPYENRDPGMQRTFSGAAKGQGSVYEWSGDSNVGKGRMEITDVTPTKVIIKLDFIEPFEGHNTAEFTLQPSSDVTTVTWAMHGPNSYIGKLMGVFIDLDDMIGKDFETGLANLKTLAESKQQQS